MVGIPNESVFASSSKSSELISGTHVALFRENLLDKHGYDTAAGQSVECTASGVEGTCGGRVCAER